MSMYFQNLKILKENSRIREQRLFTFTLKTTTRFDHPIKTTRSSGPANSSGFLHSVKHRLFWNIKTQTTFDAAILSGSNDLGDAGTRSVRF